MGLKNIFGGEKFNASLMKAQLKMSIIRIQQLKNKKTNLIKLSRRQVAELLVQEKDESARIKVENIIRDDYQIEALEILELFCDLLQTRLQLIAECHECPHDMKEAVTTIIYAAPRVEVPEFMNVRKQFSLKFGPQFVEKAMVNHDLTVNDKVMFKLGVKVPEPYLCVQYLKQIAEENNIEWADSADQNNGANNNNGGYGGMDQNYPQQAFPPSNFTQAPTVMSQQYHQTGQVSVGQNNYDANNMYNNSNIGQQPLQHQYGQHERIYPSSSTGHMSMVQPPPVSYHDMVPPQPQAPYIPPTSTTSGYEVDFQPNTQHPLEHTLPTFSNPTDSYESFAGGAQDEYNFDELQKRFDALKKRE
ncbi:vacuolar protein-sorting protein IST1 [Acrasis kona]|uniref:Vacuolar protein-sorting protein IST1 n=1 Tax=Acrasis kona TaxID=1008807 RepID=A0AAW2YSR3_9EUKA